MRSKWEALFACVMWAVTLGVVSGVLVVFVQRLFV